MSTTECRMPRESQFVADVGTGVASRLSEEGNWRSRFVRTARRWIDTQQPPVVAEHSDANDRIDWLRASPFVAMHLACFAVVWVGISPVAFAVALALYAVRMFALTGFYHRYFSHRTFRTSRAVQFVFAVIGASCVQRGPLWWAAHHRNHHRHAETAARSAFAGRAWLPLEPHGLVPDRRAASAPTRDRVPDLAKFPELRWLDRFDTLVPVCAGGRRCTGWARCWSRWHRNWAPAARRCWSGASSCRRWCCSTPRSRSTLWRTATARAGSIPATTAATTSGSPCITFGEGWHNNHHFFPGTARQGFRWWEIDLTWYGLRLMAALGLVRDLKTDSGLGRSAKAGAEPCASPSSDPGSPAWHRPGCCRVVMRWCCSRRTITWADIPTPTTSSMRSAIIAVDTRLHRPQPDSIIRC